MLDRCDAAGSTTDGEPGSEEASNCVSRVLARTSRLVAVAFRRCSIAEPGARLSRVDVWLARDGDSISAALVGGSGIAVGFGSDAGSSR